ncbi:uncharacterized protein B0I36DRAFT_102338 [Microdochium trichocladiopsis]|uniref:Uncharacterized protein n=1 Tax=Microdochium trichocladiopsis TaxID=1682393 RepID=A0A9P8Y8U9_9PEZI|nr:uncharacterized protein B0I36DRAFT_102338 [Microdochium trichocladiopsis]KAH7032915.1 hypothetical protein B0I36DRAFT_102338 [Microdochium trichocladiopsis]
MCSPDPPPPGPGSPNWRRRWWWCCLCERPEVGLASRKAQGSFLPCYHWLQRPLPGLFRKVGTAGVWGKFVPPHSLDHQIDGVDNPAVCSLVDDFTARLTQRRGSNQGSNQGFEREKIPRWPASIEKAKINMYIELGCLSPSRPAADRVNPLCSHLSNT